MSRRLILFGGTFDPVHHGHLIVARHLAELRGFGRIVLMPTAAPPHKSAAIASAEDRLAMLRLAIEGEGLFDVSDLELRREGPSYTIDTVRTLKQGRPGLQVGLVVGTDMLEEFPNWRQAGELLDEIELIAVARPPWDRRTDRILESLRGRFRADQFGRLRQAPASTPRIDIASSQVRRRIAEGRSIRYLVPESVGAYIRRNGLYGGS